MIYEQFITDTGFVAGQTVQINNYSTILVNVTTNADGVRSDYIHMFHINDRVEPRGVPKFYLYSETCDGKLVYEGHCGANDMLEHVGTGVRGIVDSKVYKNQVKIEVSSPFSMHCVAQETTLLILTQYMLCYKYRFGLDSTIVESNIIQLTNLLNMALYSSGWVQVTPSKIRPAIISYFESESNDMSRQPVNFLFEYIDIDGIYMGKDKMSVSFKYDDTIDAIYI